MSSNNDLIHIAPESDPADFFEVRVESLRVPVRVEYSAIRDLRSGFDGKGESIGLLLGSSSPQARSIQHCELLALSPATLGDPKALQGALHRFLRARLQAPLEDAPELLGCFRTQTNGWPGMRESDLEIAKRSFPGLGPIFLLIRTTQHRPWLATLYTLNAATAKVPTQPAVEFPFDEYLLRNGYLNDAGESEMPGHMVLPPAKLLDKIPWAIQLNRPRWMIAGVFSAILVLTSAATYRWSRPSGQAEGVGRNAPATGVLKLRVSRSGRDFEISWDRLSAAVQQASSGMLTINDGALTRAVALDGAQLREGQILYTPLFEELKFRLEVGTPDQALAAESVQVLAWSGKQPADVLTVPPPSAATNSLDRIFSNASAKSPAVIAETTAPAPLPIISKNVSSTTARAPAIQPASPATAVSGTPSPAASAPSVPQTVAVIQPSATRPAPRQELTPSAPAPIPEVAQPASAPPVITLPVEPPISAAPKPIPPAPKAEPPAVRPNPAPASSTSPTSLPVAPATPSVPPPPAATTAVSTGPPVLPVAIQRVAPTPPSNIPKGSARQVSVRVMVDSAGGVQSAEVVSSTPKGAFGEAVVKTAALDAAKQWKFRPGQVNGKNVVAEYTIDFKFQ